MTTSVATNTAECMKLQGKIEYNQSTPEPKDDLEAKIIDILGNSNKLIDAGATLGLVAGERFSVGNREFEILQVDRQAIKSDVAQAK